MLTIENRTSNMTATESGANTMHESYRYSTEQIDSMLGTMSDYKLAKLLGLSIYVISSRRRKLSIGPYSALY